ncbi:phage head closure protein [Emergencia sp. 1XD21-10]|uniref:phage head closure protein n=1 Tax=Emergencia sp. 1XD21-10 TaxID=2304569 RepID=UPI00137AF3C7|nr:phage head closure protein [Emergencia sp. 1XD21-10]NCE98405.1 head-tail adaptor protein [Emergencia sp. 1XD21-10]
MIGGNIVAQIQTRTTTRNSIGEQVENWAGVKELTGWLDLMSGESERLNFSQKVQESTHVLLSDYEELPEEVTAENSRLVVGGKVYDITLIDDPMGRHRQLEIFLKYAGGQGYDG